MPTSLVLSGTKQCNARISKLSKNIIENINFSFNFEQGAIKDGKTQCEQMCVVLGSPLGKIEISGCKTGVHEICLLENAVPQNR